METTSLNSGTPDSLFVERRSNDKQAKLKLPLSSRAGNQVDGADRPERLIERSIVLGRRLIRNVMQQKMITHTVSSSYRQFYVADAGLDPEAPEEWNDQHVQQRYNALKNIVALCPQGDITARVICVPPGEVYKSELSPEFEVITQIEIESGRLGVFGWPREALEEFAVPTGVYKIRFCGYNLAGIDSEEDFYVVEFESA